MSKIFIVRHGQDEDNANLLLNGRRDKPLTEQGKMQAKTVGEKLRDYQIDLIYSSPLQRAHTTAQIIAKQIGIDEVIIKDDLIEREFGILTGKPLADIPKYGKNILHTDRVDYFLEAEGAEAFPSVYKRAKKVLEDINKRHPDDTILIVAHSDIGKMIRAVYHGLTWEDGLRTPYYDNTAILELALKKDRV